MNNSSSRFENSDTESDKQDEFSDLNCEIIKVESGPDGDEKPSPSKKKGKRSRGANLIREPAIGHSWFRCLEMPIFESSIFEEPGRLFRESSNLIRSSASRSLATSVVPNAYEGKRQGVILLGKRAGTVHRSKLIIVRDLLISLSKRLSPLIKFRVTIKKFTRLPN